MKYNLKNRPFDTKLEPTMSNLVINKVILNFDNSVLLQNIFVSLYSNFISNLHLVYELNTLSRNPTSFKLKKNYLIQLN